MWIDRIVQEVLDNILLHTKRLLLQWQSPSTKTNAISRVIMTRSACRVPTTAETGFANKTVTVEFHTDTP
jgi:hypothetical protein